MARREATVLLMVLDIAIATAITATPTAVIVQS